MSFTNSFLKFFSPKKKGILETLYETLSDQISEDIKEQSPSLKWALDEGKRRISESIKNKTGELSEEDIQSIISKAYDILSDACKKTENKEVTEQISNAIETNKTYISKLKSDYNNIEDKVKLLKEYTEKLSKSKKRIKFMLMGPSQCGKSSFIKQVTGISDEDLKLKNGMTSDTTKVKEYRINRNGIEIIIVDTPGTYDSRGEDIEEQNSKEIEKYIEKNKDIDIILWVTKIDNIFDGSQQKTIKEYSAKFGKKIWKKCIIVLTYANSASIPDGFYDMVSYNGEIETEYELKVWKEYTKTKVSVWQNEFKKYSMNVPVCLVENSRRKVKEYNGVCVLKDGTPYMEEFYIKVFDVIKLDKLPIVFLSLANQRETPAIQKTVNTTTTTSSITNESVQTTSSDGREKSLNNAANRKKRGWCTII